MKITKYILISLNILWFIIFYDSKTYSLLWNISWLLLIIIVYSRPLSNIFNKIIFLKKIVNLRKELWILCATLGIAHVIGFLMNAWWLSLLLDSYYWRLDNWFWYWTYAFIISIPLLLTSNLASMKFFWKHWKNIQRFTYLFFILVWIHISIIKWYFSIEPIIVVVIWSILWIVAYFKNKSLINI